MEYSRINRSEDPSVIPLRRKERYRIIRSFWKKTEMDMFNRVEACYKLAKTELPQAFIEAIEGLNVAMVVAQLKDILESDIRMSNRLRKRCQLWLASHPSP